MTETLIDRITAIQRFLRAADGHLPDAQLVPADTLMQRIGDRLALTQEHTVVALAGTTGSGKSSLFNALARRQLSPVGVRRPTTVQPYALVWGSPADAGPLLDWLRVPPGHRLERESLLDGNDEAGLGGLILLDLPDFDSVDRAHQLEVDRVLGLVDLMIWVVDPQKYADTVLHDTYLRQFRRHREVTVVVLNQADRLSPEDAARCLADLRRLLAEDGLPGVPTLATSAHHPETLVGLYDLLEGTVAGRQAVLHRFAGDLEDVLADLSPLTGPPVDWDAVEQAGQTLVDSLAAAAGAAAIVDATERAYRERASACLDWLPARWLRRAIRRAPAAEPAGLGDLTDLSELAKLTKLTDLTGQTDLNEPTELTELTELADLTSGARPTAAAANGSLTSAVGLAVREYAHQAALKLPEAWSTAVTKAALSRADGMPSALDKAVRTTEPTLLGNPPWWRVAAAVQWLSALTSLAGLLWLSAGALAKALGLPAVEYPAAGPVPMPILLLAGGLLTGLVLGVALRPAGRLATGRAVARARRQLRFAVAEVGREYAQAPVRAVLRRYAEAAQALDAAAGNPDRTASHLVGAERPVT